MTRLYLHDDIDVLLEIGRIPTLGRLLLPTNTPSLNTINYLLIRDWASKSGTTSGVNDGLPKMTTQEGFELVDERKEGRAKLDGTLKQVQLLAAALQERHAASNIPHPPSSTSSGFSQQGPDITLLQCEKRRCQPARIQANISRRTSSPPTHSTWDTRPSIPPALSSSVTLPASPFVAHRFHAPRQLSHIHTTVLHGQGVGPNEAHASLSGPPPTTDTVSPAPPVGPDGASKPRTHL